MIDDEEQDSALEAELVPVDTDSYLKIFPGPREALESVKKALVRARESLDSYKSNSLLVGGVFMNSLFNVSRQCPQMFEYRDCHENCFSSHDVNGRTEQYPGNPEGHCSLIDMRKWLVLNIPSADVQEVKDAIDLYVSDIKQYMDENTEEG
jgi:hypothetical protein